MVIGPRGIISNYSEFEQYYDSLDKYAKAEDFVVNNEDYFDRSSAVVADEELFSHEEIETIACPNGKTCGIDGVSYEDVH